MIIGIDGNEANVTRRVGIGEYAYQLLVYFYNLRGNNESSSSSFIIYLKDKPLSYMPEEKDWWRYEIVSPRKLWTQIGLPIHLYTSRPEPDIFFTPSHYAPRFAPMPTAIAIMDVSYIHFPELFARRDLYQLTKWTEYSAKRAARIFTISESSKNDIIKTYNVSSERVIVTYPGIKDAFAVTKENMNIIEEKYNISGNYILFVGTLQPRKNIVRLIEAFSKISREENTKDVRLVVVGKKGWLYEKILEAPQTYAILEKVTFLDFVVDEDLPALYKNALFFILPSLYEGFGLPVLEAMKYGCPVITSDVSSLPEAGGEAALYIDPTDVDDIAKKMLLLINDKKLREEMSKKGYEHIKKFSWEKTAKETLKVLEETVNK